MTLHAPERRWIAMMRSLSSLPVAAVGLALGCAGATPSLTAGDDAGVADTGIAAEDAAPIDDAKDNPPDAPSAQPTRADWQPSEREIWGSCAPLHWASATIPRYGVGTPAIALPAGRLLTGMADTIYDPFADTYLYLPGFTPSPSVRLLTEPRGVTSLLLADRKTVLATGGQSESDFSSRSSDLVDVTTGKARSIAPMGAYRRNHGAFLLPNGKALVVGGEYAGIGAELFDPITEEWSSTVSPNPVFSARRTVVIPRRHR